MFLPDQLLTGFHLLETLFLHMVDAVGALHAVILRIQALVMPVQMLVFAGH